MSSGRTAVRAAKGKEPVKGSCISNKSIFWMFICIIVSLSQNQSFLIIGIPQETKENNPKCGRAKNLTDTFFITIIKK